VSGFTGLALGPGPPLPLELEVELGLELELELELQPIVKTNRPMIANGRKNSMGVLLTLVKQGTGGDAPITSNLGLGFDPYAASGAFLFRANVRERRTPLPCERRRPPTSRSIAPCRGRGVNRSRPQLRSLARGRNTENVVPVPGTLSTVIQPP
jgi:hypothetical protein